MHLPHATLPDGISFALSGFDGPWAIRGGVTCSVTACLRFLGASSSIRVLTIARSIQYSPVVPPRFLGSRFQNGSRFVIGDTYGVIYEPRPKRSLSSRTHTDFSILG